MDRLGAAKRLRELERGATCATALAFFDDLPPVAVPEMMGSWRGDEVPTGHPLTGVLARLGWRGKRFEGAERVHPLVFASGEWSTFAVDPALVPVGLVVAHPQLARLPGTSLLFRLARPILTTRRPGARLCLTQYRGILSATMCYDALPIHDVFRKVDDDTVLGAMDLRGTSDPFFFSLRRE